MLYTSGSGGLSAASTAVQDSPVIESMNADRPTSMLVMSGGEGYIDFRVGRLFLFLRLINWIMLSKLTIPVQLHLDC